MIFRLTLSASPAFPWLSSSSLGIREQIDGATRSASDKRENVHLVTSSGSSQTSAVLSRMPATSSFRSAEKASEAGGLRRPVNVKTSLRVAAFQTWILLERSCVPDAKSNPSGEKATGPAP